MGGGGFEEIEEVDVFAEDVDVGSTFLYIFVADYLRRGVWGGGWTNLWVLFCWMVELGRRGRSDKRAGETEAEPDA